MLVKPAPSPKNEPENEPDNSVAFTILELMVWVTYKLPLTSTEPVNSEPLLADTTTNPKSGVTDAVTLPLLISVEISASIASVESAVNGILNKFSPLPLNDEPLTT